MDTDPPDEPPDVRRLKRSESLEVYSDVMLVFHEWCKEHDLNFRFEVIRLVKSRMEQEP